MNIGQRTEFAVAAIEIKLTKPPHVIRMKIEEIKGFFFFQIEFESIWKVNNASQFHVNTSQGTDCTTLSCYWQLMKILTPGMQNHSAVAALLEIPC